MKFRNSMLIFLLLIFQLVGLPRLYSQTSMCSSLYSKLKKEGLKASTQNLILDGENSFPYNILLSFNSGNSGDEGSAKLVLVFFQEDIEQNPQIIANTASFIQENEIGCDITILLAYGERQKIKKDGMIFGTEVFTDNLSSKEDNTVIICDLDAPQTKVISSSRGIISPSYLTQIAYNSFLKSSLSKNVPGYYVSQLYSYDFFYDRNLSTFFNADIPCIKLAFTKDTETSSVENAINNTIRDYSQAAKRDWDHHFLMVKVFNRYLRLIETTTIKIIIVIIFIWLIFIFFLIFVNIRQKRTTWHAIKNVWYSIPVTYILIALSFFLGKLFFTIFLHPATDARTVMYLTCIQLIITIFVCSAFYIVMLLVNVNFSEKSVDYLIIFSCFINQSLFILIDISLFPIFMIICFLSILAFVIKNNPLHISIFFLMIVIFIPYISALVTNSNLSDLRLFLVTTNLYPFYLATLLYPLFMIYFRILTSISRHTNKPLTFFITHSAFFAVILIILPIFASLKAKKLEKNTIIQPVSFEKSKNEDKIIVSYTDKKIFDDIIRTLNIKTEGDCLQCDVRLKAENLQPVLYTDNDYSPISSTEGYFKIPNNPPSEMTFSYGTDSRKTLLTVTAFFKTEKEDTYALVSRSLELEAEK
ncbi:MAG: hypothetical protein IJ688_14355 [Treponema sp.]|nr:hypothetical protein [Treponema sp.]